MHFPRAAANFASFEKHSPAYQSAAPDGYYQSAAPDPIGVSQIDWTISIDRWDYIDRTISIRVSYIDRSKLH
jgi:hypothetical protein